MTEIKKHDLCWTEAFQDHIAQAILLPKIRVAIGQADKKPQDLNDLYKVFIDLYKLKMTKKYFIKSCELLGLEFETRVEIKAKNVEVSNTYPPESEPVVYNPIPPKPQGQGNQFNPDFGGIVNE